VLDTEKQIILNKIVDQVLRYSGNSGSKHRDDIYGDSDMFTSSATFTTVPISLKLNRRDHYDSEFAGSIGKQSSSFVVNNSIHKASIENEARSRLLEYNRASQDDEYLKFTNKYLRDKSKSSAVSAQDASSGDKRTEELASTRLFNSLRNTGDDTQELVGPDIIRMKVSVFIDDQEEVLLLSIYKGRQVRDLRDLVVSKLKAKYPGLNDKDTLIQIVHKSKILNLENSLEDSGVRSGMKFDVLVQEQRAHMTTTMAPDDDILAKPKKIETDTASAFAPLDKLPIMRRTDYTLHPSLIEMARMNEFQLSTVEDLYIENRHGRIAWEGRTDVRGVDFDELVTIDQFAATVYPEHIERLNLKPEIGKGLNKPAIISLNNIIAPSSEAKKRRFVDKLKAKTACMDDAVFLNFDEAKGILTFRVAHFTRYDLSNIDADGEQSEDSEEVEAEPKHERLEQLAKPQDKERLSFGYQPRRPLHGSGTPATIGDIEPMDERSHEADSLDDMDVERNPRYALNMLANNLDGIREESESKASSEFGIDDERLGFQRPHREHKIHFGEVVEKEFEEDNFDSPADEDEEDEAPSDRCGDHVLTLDSIRAAIKSQRSKIAESLAWADEQRARQKAKPDRVSAMSTPTSSGFRNQMLFESGCRHQSVGSARM